MKILLLVIPIFLLSISIHAQNFQEIQVADTVIGLVVNKKGKAVKNVPVTIQRTKESVQTDKKGIFILTNVDLLKDSLVLFLPKGKLLQIPVSGLTFIKIKIKDDNYNYATTQAKEEIINIGYGTQKKKQSTIGNSVFTGDQLRESGNDILSALVGKVPGLRIVYGSDGIPSVTIRGGSSINLDNTPLYIVDGSVTESLDHVNLNDVDKVTILKDGSMYGVRGANGAIVVTTKSE